MYQERRGSELSRRASLGLELRRRDDGEGALVARVVQGGTAALAGIVAGDHIVAIDDEPVRDARHLVVLANERRSGATISFTLVRGEHRLVRDGVVRAAAIERVRGAEVTLGEVTVEGRRLRTLRTTPLASPPTGVVLMLPGLGAGSCELAADEHDPKRRLIEGLTELGLSTLRVERSGTGDSEGPPPSEVGFFTELSAYRAALDALAREGVNVLLYGESVGGMMAPLLAGERADEHERVAGVVVWGTSSLRWSDCLTQAMRRQRHLGGAPDAAEIEALAELYRMVFSEGLSPGDIFAGRPDLAHLEGPSCHGATMFGRHVSFFQELERVDLVRLWSTVAAPVLVLHGELDWVCLPAEGRGVAEAAGARAEFVELRGLGHDLLWHESLSRSFAEPRRGTWDGSVIAAIREWGRSAIHD